MKLYDQLRNEVISYEMIWSAKKWSDQIRKEVIK